MEKKLYSIGISLYSDELYPDDYEDGQENIYEMDEEQYQKFKELTLSCSYDIHEWCLKNLHNSNISLTKEFIDEVAGLDQMVFDYHRQEYLIG